MNEQTNMLQKILWFDHGTCTLLMHSQAFYPEKKSHVKMHTQKTNKQINK